MAEKKNKAGSKRRSRIGYFLFVLLVGIFIGASLMWWQQSLNRTGWRFPHRVKSIISNIFGGMSDDMDKIKTTFAEKGMPQKTDKTRSSRLGRGAKYVVDEKGDTIVLSDSLEQGGLAGGGSQGEMIPPDSLAADSLKQAMDYELRNDETVMRDELLFAKTMRAAGTPPGKGRSGNLDSLLTDDMTSSPEPKDVYRVEFWRSPINYRGYKLISNRLVLFGMNDYSGISLEYVNNALYLKSHNNYFLIESYDDFKPYLLVKNIKGPSKPALP